MVGVGINENVVLGKDTKVNEKGTLEVIFKEGENDPNALWESLAAGKEVKEGVTKIMFWPISMTTFDGDAKSPNKIVEELQNFVGTLKKILLVYMTSEAAEEYIDITAEKMFENLVFDKDQIAVHLRQEEFVNGAARNVANGFMRACTEKELLENEQTFRLKLRRQSKEKHFPKIPVGFTPWIESSIISKEESKLGWDKYEEENGLNIVGAVTPGDVPKEEAADVSNLFAKPVEEITEVQGDSIDTVETTE